MALLKSVRYRLGRYHERYVVDFFAMDSRKIGNLLNIMITKIKSECNSIFFNDFMYNGYCWSYGENFPCSNLSPIYL